MAQVTAADVSKLRKLTGAGMMDCKNALVEADGNIERAIELIRERGKAIANKRADREAGEGVALAKTTADGKRGALIVLNCETDFVAKNENFISLAQQFLEVAIQNNPADLDALKKLTLNGKVIEDIVLEQTGVIGEKLDLSFFDKIEAAQVTAYIHSGNKLATLVGLNKGGIDAQVGKDIAMQITAMNPVSVSEESVPKHIADKELEIGREQARLEGKPENMLDKIAQGKLAKFFKESTLLSQDFIKDGKKTVNLYLKEVDKDLTVTGFVRFSLNL